VVVKLELIIVNYIATSKFPHIVFKLSKL